MTRPRKRDDLDLGDLPQTDERLREHTGRGWIEWMRVLDAWGAMERSHRDVAAHLMEEHGVSGWWAQTITVGYERARGIRAKHQTLTGSFQVSVSKTLPVAAAHLFEAFIDPSVRDRWLEPGILRLRTSREHRGARFDFGDDGSRVVVSFDAKGPGKTTVTVQHEWLLDAAAVEELRAMWRERLGRLAVVLER